MRLTKIGFQAQSDSKLRNAFRDVLLRQEDPAEKIVSLCAAGCELYNLFKGAPSLREIAALQGRQASAVRCLGLVLWLSKSEIRGRDNERRPQHPLEGNYDEGVYGAPVVKTGRLIWFEAHQKILLCRALQDCFFREVCRLLASYRRPVRLDPLKSAP